MSSGWRAGKGRPSAAGQMGRYCRPAGAWRLPMPPRSAGAPRPSDAGRSRRWPWQQPCHMRRHASIASEEPPFTMKREDLKGLETTNQLTLDLFGILVGDLAGTGGKMATAAVFKHQRPDSDWRRPVDDRFADGEHGVLLLQPPENMHGDPGLRMKRVDHEAVAGMNDLLSAQVEDDDIAMNLGKPVHLINEELLLSEIQLDPLRHVRKRQDAVDIMIAAIVDQGHHELIVGDLETPEAPKAGARVHQEVQERPARRLEDVVD